MNQLEQNLEDNIEIGVGDCLKKMFYSQSHESKRNKCNNWLMDVKSLQSQSDV